MNDGLTLSSQRKWREIAATCTLPSRSTGFQTPMIDSFRVRVHHGCFPTKGMSQQGVLTTWSSRLNTTVSRSLGLAMTRHESIAVRGRDKTHESAKNMRNGNFETRRGGFSVSVAKELRSCVRERTRGVHPRTRLVSSGIP